MRRLWMVLLLAGCVPQGGSRLVLSEDEMQQAPACDTVTYGECIAPIVEISCLGCHSTELPDTERFGAPAGVDFDTEADLSRWAERMLIRVASQTMPPGGMDPDAKTHLSSYLTDLVSTCTPACDGRTCGDDGCGSVCGTCSGGLVCDTRAGGCVANCTPDCAARVCGDDGCGGSCGTCAANELCNGVGQCECSPACAGLNCGDDGCGGSCGECDVGGTCNAGQCQYPESDFATDVMPIFDRAGCAAGNCHSQPGPRAALDLSSARVAVEELVDQRTGQCAEGFLVVPGDPSSSYLLNKLTGIGMCSGEVMPRDGVVLTPAEIETIRNWIGNGAAP